MVVFDEACARGFMDASRARACLHAKRASLGGSPEERRAGMKTSGAGSKVLQWLLSTGAESDASWLQQKGQGSAWGKDIIFDFLVLEGKQEALWELFERYAALNVRDGQNFLFQLSRSLAHNISVDAGLESMARADKIMLKEETRFNARIRILSPAMSLLINFVKNENGKSENIQLSPTHFDRFLGIVQMFPTLTIVSRRDLFIPQLYLRHPTNPDAGFALRYLKSLSEAAPEKLLEATNVLSDPLASLALDTAKQLMANEQFDDARWVLGFVQKTYPELNQGNSQPETKPGNKARAMGMMRFVNWGRKEKSEARLSQAGKTTPVQEEDDMASVEELDRLDLGVTGS